MLSLCRTLRDAFDIGVRYQHRLGRDRHLQRLPAGDTFFVEVECHLLSSGVQVFAIEEFFASLLVYGRPWSPGVRTAGHRTHPCPLRPTRAGTCPAGAPQVRFGCLHNRMAIASHWLDMRLPNHNLPALRQALALLEQESTQVHRKLDLVRRWNGPSPAT